MPSIKINELGSCSGDGNLIRQVLTNLISNAIKYSSKKENAIVEIGCTRQGEEKVYYVKDNGAGFDMKNANKLFQVFQRLHSMAEFEGTGIGLALAKNIVTRHGGRIWAESERDKGATFYFSLPA
jgi:light-regulated signal transduction histidine kinase (bacteriophytochrome)